ncbi:acyl carrier protein [Streptomyces sp. NPDC057287]|uniref:acyl carrier protein n=1 Tax=Streptomyces sp. NPDC057287 TaxID=3346086 RepID=UPI0036429D81
MDWDALLGRGPAAPPRDVPVYPFQHTSYWLSRTPSGRTGREPLAVGPQTVREEAGEPLSPLAALEPDDRHQAVLAHILEAVDEALGHPPGTVEADADLTEAGITSFGSLEIATRLSARIGFDVRATVVFEHPTARELAHHLGRLLAGRLPEAVR